MKFSIVIPAYNAAETIDRALGSLMMQSVGNEEFEVIVVDDASMDNTLDLVADWTNILPMKILKHQTNLNKAIARNNGMKAAKGEWICWLDSDDYYLPHYLEVMTQAIEKYPEAKIFNFGGIVTWSRWDQQVRMSNTYNKGDVFRSGGIMSGSFIFKRELLEECGYLPEERSPYAFGQEMLERYPEVKPLYKPGQLDLGNPWGDDWSMFYILTRKNGSQFLQVSPYVIMPRGEKHL